MLQNLSETSAWIRFICMGQPGQTQRWWSRYRPANRGKVHLSWLQATSSVTTMLQKLQWDSLQERRVHSRVLMRYRIHNGLVAIPASAYLHPATAHTRGSETRYRHIQCNTNAYSHIFFPTAVCPWNTANCRQTASKHNSAQSSWCKCLPALFLSSVGLLHRFYMFIVITVCLNHCFCFTHLDPLTAVRYYSTWIGTYCIWKKCGVGVVWVRCRLSVVWLWFECCGTFWAKVGTYGPL